MVAITPRSFANGTYFKAFRKQLFSLLGIDRLSVFQERGTLFADLSVLQENIILTASRGRRPEKVTVVHLGVIPTEPTNGSSLTKTFLGRGPRVIPSYTDRH